MKCSARDGFVESSIIKPPKEDDTVVPWLFWCFSDGVVALLGDDDDDDADAPFLLSRVGKEDIRVISRCMCVRARAFLLSTTTTTTTRMNRRRVSSSSSSSSSSFIQRLFVAWDDAPTLLPIMVVVDGKLFVSFVSLRVSRCAFKKRAYV